jgi:Carboxypeptidase regulatory-like domain
MMAQYPSVIFLFLLAGWASAQTGSASVSGTVVNGKTGEPIKGAQVTVTQPMGAPPAGQKAQESVAMTLADGSFRISGLDEGSFFVGATKPGFAFQPAELPISRTSLKAGETLESARILLPRSAY